MSTVPTGKKDIREPFRLLYMLLMAVLVLWYIYDIATFKSSRRLATWVIVARCVSTVMAVWLGQLWKDKGFWFLMALLLFMFLRIWIPDHGILAKRNMREELLLGIWLFGGCYGLARVLTEKQLKQFLLVIATIWVIATVAYSSVGIYAAWTERKIRTLTKGGAVWYMDPTPMRLKLVYGISTSGAVLGLGAMITTCMLFSAKKRSIARPLLCLAMLPILIAISLNDSRTTMITYAIALGVLVCMRVVRHMSEHRGKPMGLDWLFGGAAFVLVCAVTVFALMHSSALVNQFKSSRGELLISSAAAEETAETAEAADEAAEEETEMFLLERDFTGLSGREECWKYVLQHISNHPEVLLYGDSMYKPMRGPHQLYYIKFVHCHNTLLQILLESGIPGLLLIGGFLVTLFTRGFRLIRGCRTLDKWKWVLPALVFGTLAGEMVECFIILFRRFTPMQPIIFICMGIVCVYGMKKKEPKAAENEKVIPIRACA